MVRLDGVVDICDLDLTSAGLIALLDCGARSLLIIDASGNVKQRFDGGFNAVSGVGVGVQPDAVYVTSPSLGTIYNVSLDTGAIGILPISAKPPSEKAGQPSDIAVAPDGRLFVADFDRKKIVISADGVAAEKIVPGVGGSGLHMPHVALYHGLLLVSDPQNQRIVMYDRAGTERGAFLFAVTATATAQPIGISVSPDGLVYVADPRNGYIYRLKLRIPPQSQDLAQ